MLLADLVDPVQPIQLIDSLETVLEYFRENQHIIVVPVINQNDAPCGILRERDLKKFVYSRYGQEILRNKQLDEFVHLTAVCDVNTKTDILVELFTHEENSDGIIITENGRYKGFLSAAKLLKMIYELNMEEKKRESVDSLVVGIAHEINTPIGICITATSYLVDKIKEIREGFQNGKLKRSHMEGFLDTTQETANALMGNLERSASLIQSFKRVSVDRNHEEISQVKVYEFTQNIIHSFHERLKKQKISVELECEQDLVIETFTESFIEIIRILLDNALMHAFDEDSKKGTISIEFAEKGDYAHIVFKDDGKGIPESKVDKIFEPFYTTKRNRGKSGLGLHVLQNIVVQRMKGTISCKSVENKGTTFLISIPIR